MNPFQSIERQQQEEIARLKIENDYLKTTQSHLAAPSLSGGASSSSAAAAAAAASSATFPHDAVCDRCSQYVDEPTPIVGVRFKCYECADYNLCAECMAVAVHSKSHLFLRVGPGQVAETTHHPVLRARTKLDHRESIGARSQSTLAWASDQILSDQSNPPHRVLAKLHTAFDWIDLDGNGSLEADDFPARLYNPSEIVGGSLWDFLRDKMDRDKNHAITFDEFVVGFVDQALKQSRGADCTIAAASTQGAEFLRFWLRAATERQLDVFAEHMSKFVSKWATFEEVHAAHQSTYTLPSDTPTHT